MGEEGFTENELGEIRSAQSAEWSFYKGNSLNIRFVAGIPIPTWGKFGEYLKDLCESMLENQRVLTLEEYAVITAAKCSKEIVCLEPAKLGDIVDISLILHREPGIFSGEYFAEITKKLNIPEEVKMLSGICGKIMDAGPELNEIGETEKSFLLELIRHPYSRISYIKEKLEGKDRDIPEGDKLEYTVSKDRKLAYLVNSKAACSSIKACFLHRTVPDGYFVHNEIIYRNMDRSKLSGDEESYFRFTFVRNPFIRLVSCYESKYHNDPGRYGRKNDLEEYLSGYMGKDEGFDVFVKKACALPYRLMDRHFRSQYDLIYDSNGNCRCDFVGRFESLEEEFEPIRREYNLEPLPHLNSTDVTNWMDYYTAETVELVYRTFKRDFVAFGYENSYKELMNYIDNEFYC